MIILFFMEKIIIKEPSKELVHCIIGINQGWRHEKPGKRGITHLLEHSIFFGNKFYPEPDKEAEKYGVEIEGMTLPEKTLFYFTSLKKDFSKILNMFLSIIFHPESDDVKLEKEKKEKIITAIINEADYPPWDLAEEWAENLIFNWQFKTSLGTKKDIESITKEDLILWHKKYYWEGNSFILIYGDIKEKEIERLIKNANIPKKGEKPLPYYVNHNKKEIYIKKKDIRNVETVYGFEIKKYDICWEVLKTILYDYLEDKLGKYTYMIDLKLRWTNTQGGLFIYLGISSPKYIKEVDKNLWITLRNLEIDKKKLDLVKKIINIEIIKMKEEGEKGVLRFISFNPFLKYKDFKEMIEKVKKIDKEEALNLTKELLTKENMVKVSVGP
ncbi:MAG: pitrilysin family protein [candidate division WOR-3 bacterium]